MLVRIIFLALISIQFSHAQNIQYVNAENGLVVREKPSRVSNRVSMLDYGTGLEITEFTNLQLDVMDSGKKLSGEWVKVRSIDGFDVFEGYVFNGYLTENVLKKRFKVKYDEFTVSVEGVSEKTANNKIELNDILLFKLDHNETLEEKTIRVKHHQEFRSIQVFQKHENSIFISDDNSHCDIINWQHYYSSWKPLKTISSNHKFKTLSISKKEANKFIDVDINAFKTIVKNDCGESWSNSIKDIESVYDYPASIKVSKVFLRILMTDIDGFKTEKIIIFVVPIDYIISSNSYAKL